MSHSYAPGLRVTPHAVLHRERRLPLRGEVLVARGDRVEPSTIVARTDLPGNIHMVNLSGRLGVDPARAAATLAVPLGGAIAKGEVLARASSLFGMVKNQVESPATGTLESVSNITGQLVLREAPIPIEVRAYVDGIVSKVLPDEGVVIETRGAFLQGIFGIGGETHGAIEILADDPAEMLSEARLHDGLNGRVVVGGAGVTHATLLKARDAGVRAVIVGGFDDGDLKLLLGRDLGVAITGSENLGITLILTEGFGRMRMADRTWNLLMRHHGAVASVSGATQIRAGVQRPEILIPDAAAPAQASGEAASPGLALGAWLRIVRAPLFGRIGRVVDLPAALATLESGARVRVVTVELTDGSGPVTVPRANVERIEE